ncbi:MAG: hypothetical protein WA140_07595 [Geobacteraceae bacterium]
MQESEIREAMAILTEAVGWESRPGRQASRRVASPWRLYGNIQP